MSSLLVSSFSEPAYFVEITPAQAGWVLQMHASMDRWSRIISAGLLPYLFFLLPILSVLTAIFQVNLG